MVELDVTCLPVVGCFAVDCLVEGFPVVDPSVGDGDVEGIVLGVGILAQLGLR